MLNPYFLQGSSSEQRLIQDLINEQLKMYGVSVGYMPRGFAVENTIISEDIIGNFKDNFYIEAYVGSYNGFGGGGDIMSKFGIKASDELTLIISREIFEDFISPFIETAFEDEKYKISNRPKEGDLIYFPFTNILYEIKFVEHETEFYQLNKLYVYELRCEPFMFEDEEITTGIEEIDSIQSDRGIDTILTLSGYGITAQASTSLVTGGVNRIYMVNDGYGYSSTPTVAISSAPAGGTNATAIAQMIKSGITTTYSVNQVLITNPGAGYTIAPTITFIAGGGSGAIATAGITTTCISRITITNPGTKYSSPPTITIAPPPAGGITAIATANIGAGGTITNIYISNAGAGYTTIPAITFPTATAGIGTYDTYVLNENIIGSATSTTALVKTWDASTGKLHAYRLDGKFIVGEVITGISNGAKYFLESIDYFNDNQNFESNDDIENEADQIIDFSESNPFGEY